MGATMSGPISPAKAPQESPTPKPQATILRGLDSSRSPSASMSAQGMEAELWLPYFSTISIGIFSGGNPHFFPTVEMMKRLA